MSKTSISFSKENMENISDNVIYSLILRLRESYIVNCLIKNRKSTTKEFVRLTEFITGSDNAYEAYLRIKNGKKSQRIILIDIAEKLYSRVLKEIKKQEKWMKIKERKR